MKNNLLDLDWNGAGTRVYVNAGTFTLVREAVKKYSRSLVIQDLVVNELMDQEQATRIVVLALRANENDGTVVSEATPKTRRRRVGNV